MFTPLRLRQRDHLVLPGLGWFFHGGLRPPYLPLNSTPHTDVVAASVAPWDSSPTAVTDQQAAHEMRS